VGRIERRREEEKHGEERDRDWKLEGRVKP